MSMNNSARIEYPRPQLVRNDWMNLNGEWEFEMDQSVSGKERELYNAEHLGGHINVPFCPESELSGIGFKDFINCVWYRKEIELPKDWTNEIVRLHFGAVDYEATVYVNGQEVGSHKGGYDAFYVDITEYLKTGEKNVITVCAEDNVRSGRQPAGKQSWKYASASCHYTRTTGIWQTVWMEKLPKNHIENIFIYPDVDNTRVRISANVVGCGELTVKATYEGKPMGEATVNAVTGMADVIIDLAEAHLWELGAGRLYDLEITYAEDKVTSYFGLRSVRMDGMKFLLNGKSVFQRLVLDQGFYPDGIYTAPTDEALVHDIEISMAAGFNGARLHEKAFEPRFLYHCDRLGYMVWGEHANWSFNTSDYQAFEAYIPEWTSLVERDFNHPSIVTWCPMNETWDYRGKPQIDSLIRIVYELTKKLDPTRPCVDASGNFHVKTDIFDLHDYDQNPETFRARYEPFKNGGELDTDSNTISQGYVNRPHVYHGEPVCVSEYGGIKWDVDGGIVGWGYGNAPQSEKEFIERYRGLTNTLLEHPNMFGFCYTQLYDVEQEKNGLYTYGRIPKFDIEIFRQINIQKAAIED